jgi:hypothetical protein
MKNYSMSSKKDIDEEWSRFMSSENDEDISYKGSKDKLKKNRTPSSNDIDDEWAKFMSSKNDDDISYAESDDIVDYNSDISDLDFHKDIDDNIINNYENVDAPDPTDIYISTKTKIAYLNSSIDINNIFWKINIIPYHNPICGVIKKQMKFISFTQEKLDEVRSHLKDDHYIEEQIIMHIDNPDCVNKVGKKEKIKFKDTRKISIGISKKNLLNVRSKQKGAFSNCFVMIIRIILNNVFKEFHVKVFNTGKVEMPGMKDDSVCKIILDETIKALQPLCDFPLSYKSDSFETVLINANFNCKYFVNRESLVDILKMKYNIQTIYDPCSYPGIQCKFHYNPDITTQNGCPISDTNKNLYKNVKIIPFMIFRTGSVLIVGKCDENVLMIIYDFVKTLLKNEFKNVCQRYSSTEEFVKEKDKVKKIRKKQIVMSN